MRKEVSKQELLNSLLSTIKLTRGGTDIKDLQLAENEETVYIVYASGSSQAVNIACDSGMAIILDVCKNIVL